MTELLLLRAEEPDDLILLSACTQDMAILARDIVWQPKQRRLLLMGNRFRWENAALGPRQGGSTTRVRSVLRFDYVLSVQRRDWPAAADAVLPLLAITFEDGEDGADELILSFGGGAALRLRQEVLDMTLEDVSGPWASSAIPDHDAD